MDVSKLNAAIRDIRMPARMSRLPINERGYPIPYFVAVKANGEHDFRYADAEKFESCIKQRLCWLCGDRLGQYMVFAIGPMCVVNRNTSEPPCHLECAQYACRACPFLSNPAMRRNEKALTEEGYAAGILIPRNPGVTALWITKRYRLKHDEKGMILFDIGEPTNVIWYREGRPATRGEVLESMYNGLPSLEQHVHTPDEKEFFVACVARAMHWLPREDSDARSLRHGERDREGVRSSEQSAEDDKPASSG